MSRIAARVSLAFCIFVSLARVGDAWQGVDSSTATAAPAPGTAGVARTNSLDAKEPLQKDAATPTLSPASLDEHDSAVRNGDFVLPQLIPPATTASNTGRVEWTFDVPQPPAAGPDHAGTGRARTVDYVPSIQFSGAQANEQPGELPRSDTEGLMWWSADQEVDRCPVQMLLPPQSWMNRQYDDQHETKAGAALNGCQGHYGEYYNEFFKKIDTLTASGKIDDQSIDAESRKVPDNCALAYFEAFGEEPRNFQWEDRTPLGMDYVFCHRPLYFEDANLERCGYSVAHEDCCCCCCGSCLQNVISAAHFFGTIPLLPYWMTHQCPCQCVPSKGRCPEGCRYGCCENYLPPWDWQAAVVEAGAITGVIFLIP